MSSGLQRYNLCTKHVQALGGLELEILSTEGW